MISRYYRLVTSFCLLGLLSGNAPGQSTPTPAPSKSTKKEGYIRFFNMLPRKEGALKITRTDSPPGDAGLMTCDAQNSYAQYQPVPPVRYQVKVVREKDPQTSLANFDLILRPDVYVTFIALLKDGKPVVTMDDDTYDPAAATTGLCTVRNFLPDSTVDVTVDANTHTSPIAYGAKEVLNNLPLKSALFHISGTSTSGKTWQWEAPMELTSTTPHGSLMIIADHYGNLRTRTTTDGYLPPVEAAVSGASGPGGQK